MKSNKNSESNKSKNYENISKKRINSDKDIKNSIKTIIKGKNEILKKKENGIKKHDFVSFFSENEITNHKLYNIEVLFLECENKIKKDFFDCYKNCINILLKQIYNKKIYSPEELLKFCNIFNKNNASLTFKFDDIASLILKSNNIDTLIDFKNIITFIFIESDILYHENLDLNYLYLSPKLGWNISKNDYVDAYPMILNQHNNLIHKIKELLKILSKKEYISALELFCFEIDVILNYYMNNFEFYGIDEGLLFKGYIILLHLINRIKIITQYLYIYKHSFPDKIFDCYDLNTLKLSKFYKMQIFMFRSYLYTLIQTFNSSKINLKLAYKNLLKFSYFSSHKIEDKNIELNENSFIVIVLFELQNHNHLENHYDINLNLINIFDTNSDKSKVYTMILNYINEKIKNILAIRNFTFLISKNYLNIYIEDKVCVYKMRNLLHNDTALNFIKNQKFFIQLNNINNIQSIYN